MSFFTVVTSARTFQIEAAGIGDALVNAMQVIDMDRETIVEVR